VTTRAASGRFATAFTLAAAAALLLAPALPHLLALSPSSLTARGAPTPELAAAPCVRAEALVSTPCSVAAAAASPQATPGTQPRTATPPPRPR